MMFNQALEQLLTVKKEDVTLKYAFENIRNHLSVAALGAAGIFMWKHDNSPIAFQHTFHLVGAIGLGLLAFLLFVLNIMQMCMALAHQLKIVGVYLLMTLLVFALSMEFVFSSVLGATVAADARFDHQPALPKN